MTFFDNKMALPNGPSNAQRTWQGQHFVWHRKDDAVWSPARLPGFEQRDTGIAEATSGLAGVSVLRSADHARQNECACFARHDAGILFTFVLEGSLEIDVIESDRGGGAHSTHVAGDGDAFLVPPEVMIRYKQVRPSAYHISHRMERAKA